MLKIGSFTIVERCNLGKTIKKNPDTDPFRVEVGYYVGVSSAAFRPDPSSNSASSTCIYLYNLCAADGTPENWTSLSCVSFKQPMRIFSIQGNSVFTFEQANLALIAAFDASAG